MGEEYPVKAVHTAFRIISEIHQRNGAGVSEIARALDLSKGGVYKHLQTLSNLGYLSREGDEYYVGLSFLEIGLAARARFPVYQFAVDAIENLAETSGYVASLVAYEGGRGVCVAHANKNDSLKHPIQEGDRVPLLSLIHI